MKKTDFISSANITKSNMHLELEGSASPETNIFSSDQGAHFKDAYFQKTPNVWITEDVFHSYLRDVFTPNLNCRKPVVLFVDGHSSHHSLAISTLCQEKVLSCTAIKSKPMQAIRSSYWIKRSLGPLNLHGMKQSGDTRMRLGRALP